MPRKRKVRHPWPDEDIESVLTTDPSDERAILELGASVGFIDDEQVPFVGLKALAEVVPLAERELYRAAFRSFQESMVNEGYCCFVDDEETMLVATGPSVSCLNRDYFRLVRRREPQ